MDGCWSRFKDCLQQSKNEERKKERKKERNGGRPGLEEARALRPGGPGSNPTYSSSSFVKRKIADRENVRKAAAVNRRGPWKRKKGSYCEGRRWVDSNKAKVEPREAKNQD